MTDFAPRLEALFDFLPAEVELAPLAVEGALPAGLRGTAWWIGPSRFERGGLRYRNWLDGDGMAMALHFGERGADFTARFVRGEKWSAEEAAGRALYRAFGTAFPGDRAKKFALGEYIRARRRCQATLRYGLLGTILTAFSRALHSRYRAADRMEMW